MKLSLIDYLCQLEHSHLTPQILRAYNVLFVVEIVLYNESVALVFVSNVVHRFSCLRKEFIRDFNFLQNLAWVDV